MLRKSAKAERAELPLPPALSLEALERLQHGWDHSNYFVQHKASASVKDDGEACAVWEQRSPIFSEAIPEGTLLRWAEGSGMVRVAADHLNIQGGGEVELMGAVAKGVSAGGKLKAMVHFNSTHCANSWHVQRVLEVHRGEWSLDYSALNKKIHFDKEFVKDVSNLPLNITAERDFEAWEAFKEKYGSHFVSKLQMGGKVALIEEVKVKEEDKKKGIDIAQHIAAEAASILKLKLGNKFALASEHTQFEEASGTKVRTVGGSKSLAESIFSQHTPKETREKKDQDGGQQHAGSSLSFSTIVIREWEESVDGETQAPIFMIMQPITTLFAIVDPMKGKELCQIYDSLEPVEFHLSCKQGQFLECVKGHFPMLYHKKADPALHDVDNTRFLRLFSKIPDKFYFFHIASQEYLVTERVDKYSMKLNTNPILAPNKDAFLFKVTPAEPAKDRVFIFPVRIRSSIPKILLEVTIEANVRFPAPTDKDERHYWTGGRLRLEHEHKDKHTRHQVWTIHLVNEGQTFLRHEQELKWRVSQGDLTAKLELAATKKLEDAQAMYESVGEKDPRGYYLLAQRLIKTKGQYKQAIDNYTKAATHPSGPYIPACYQLGVPLLENGGTKQLDFALECLHNAADSETHPMPEAQFALANHFMSAAQKLHSREEEDKQDKLYQEAMRYFEKAQAYSPDAKYHLARIYHFGWGLKEPQPEMVRPLLEKAGNCAAALVMLGELEEYEKRYREAFDYYSQAYEIDKSGRYPHAAYAMAILLSGVDPIEANPRRAEKLFTKAAVGGFNKAWTRLGILAESHDPELAIEHYKKAKGDVNAFFYLGLLYYNRGNFRKAHKSFKRAVRDGNHLRSMYYLRDVCNELQISLTLAKDLEEKIATERAEFPNKKVDKKVEEALVRRRCTFAVTHRRFYAQFLYNCITCDLVGKRGICKTCVSRCHKGHKVSPEFWADEFFCDCHEKECLALESTPTSEKVSEKELEINGETPPKKHHKKSKKSTIKKSKEKKSELEPSEPAKHKKKKKKTIRDSEEEATKEEPTNDKKEPHKEKGSKVKKTKKGSKVKRHVDTITGRKESKKKHREHTL